MTLSLLPYGKSSSLGLEKSANECLIRNLSLTLGELAGSTAKATATEW